MFHITVIWICLVNSSQCWIWLQIFRSRSICLKLSWPNWMLDAWLSQTILESFSYAKLLFCKCCPGSCGFICSSCCIWHLKEKKNQNFLDLKMTKLVFVCVSLFRESVVFITVHLFLAQQHWVLSSRCGRFGSCFFFLTHRVGCRLQLCFICPPPPFKYFPHTEL